MTPWTAQFEWHNELASMQSSLREAGMLFIACDNEGNVIWPFEMTDDHVQELLGQAAPIKRALKDAVGTWSEQETPNPIEAIPNVWLLATPILRRRRCIGFAVAIVPTEAILEGDSLAGLCRATGKNLHEVKQGLAALPPATKKELPRLSVLVRHMYENQSRIAADQEAMVSVGQQLSESYEEINLLYTITKSIKEVDRPDRLVAFACRELLATLPFTWIGAQLADDERRLKRLNRQFIMAGEASHSSAQLGSLAQELIKQAVPDVPMVFEPGRQSEHAYLLPMGRTVLAYPISNEDQVIGLLIAGGKQGPDTTVTSADIKLVGATASHLSIFLENAALYDDLNAMFLGMLEALTSAIDAKDRYTCGHSHRVASLTKQLAEAAGLDEHAVDRMHITGLVHDVGKIGVPEAVLTKPGRLTKEEFDLIKKHPEIGYRILKDIPQLQDILPGVLYHHESWDGRGYPHGLRGEQIPLVARVIALADSFDAMSSTRTYRSAMSREEVLEEIKRCTGTQFDPELAPIFLQLSFAEYDRLTIEHREAELGEDRIGGQAA